MTLRIEIEREEDGRWIAEVVDIRVLMDRRSMPRLLTKRSTKSPRSRVMSLPIE
jgi:hypothetical protein